MIFQNLLEFFSLEFSFLFKIFKFSPKSSFSKFSFFIICLFLFNFVSMDYSRYVIKASDGSFINSSCEYCESRDDSSGHPWVYCVFHLIRFCEIIWILHGKLSFMSHKLWRHKNASWSSLNLKSFWREVGIKIRRLPNQRS